MTQFLPWLIADVWSIVMRNIGWMKFVFMLVEAQKEWVGVPVD